MKSVLGILMIVCTAAHADMHKCKDAAGNISYQQNPCEKATIGKIRRDTSVGDPAVVAKRKAESDQFNDRYLRRIAADTEAAERRQQAAMESRKARALEDQADATREQARAIENAGRKFWR